MKNNTAHVNASFSLRIETELDSEEFQRKFHVDTIVGSKVEITLPDGSVHRLSFADMNVFDVEEFEENEAEIEKSHCQKPVTN